MSEARKSSSSSNESKELSKEDKMILEDKKDEINELLKSLLFGLRIPTPPNLASAENRAKLHAEIKKILQDDKISPGAKANIVGIWEISLLLEEKKYDKARQALIDRRLNNLDASIFSNKLMSYTHQFLIEKQTGKEYKIVIKNEQGYFILEPVDFEPSRNILICVNQLLSLPIFKTVIGKRSTIEDLKKLLSSENPQPNEALTSFAANVQKLKKIYELKKGDSNYQFQLNDINKAKKNRHKVYIALAYALQQTTPIKIRNALINAFDELPPSIIDTTEKENLLAILFQESKEIKKTQQNVQSQSSTLSETAGVLTEAREARKPTQTANTGTKTEPKNIATKIPSPAAAPPKADATEVTADTKDVKKVVTKTTSSSQPSADSTKTNVTKAPATIKKLAPAQRSPSVTVTAVSAQPKPSVELSDEDTEFINSMVSSLKIAFETLSKGGHTNRQVDVILNKMEQVRKPGDLFFNSKHPLAKDILWDSLRELKTIAQNKLNSLGNKIDEVLLPYNTNKNAFVKESPQKLYELTMSVIITIPGVNKALQNAKDTKSVQETKDRKDAKDIKQQAEEEKEKEKRILTCIKMFFEHKEIAPIFRTFSREKSTTQTSIMNLFKPEHSSLQDFEKSFRAQKKFVQIRSNLNKSDTRVELTLEDMDKFKGIIRGNKRRQLYVGIAYALQQASLDNKIAALREVVKRLPLKIDQKELLFQSLEPPAPTKRLAK